MDELRERLRRPSMNMEQALKIPSQQLIVPTIHYRKEMKPTQDEAYIALLEKMEEKGLPIPKRIWAAAGGYDLDSAIEMMDEDKALTKRIAALTEEEKPEEAPPEEEGPPEKGPPKKEVAPSGEPKEPGGLEKLEKLLGPAEKPGAKPDREVKPEKPPAPETKRAEPVSHPAPPSEVKPRRNPMGQVVRTLPFWTDGEFVGLRRATAMALADRLDHAVEARDSTQAVHEIVRSVVTKRSLRPVALYLAARAGLPVGQFADQDVQRIAAALCQSPAPAREIIQELATLTYLTSQRADEPAERFGRLAARKLAGRLGRQAAEDLTALPPTSPHMLGGVG
jgi:hypothetical protein